MEVLEQMGPRSTENPPTGSLIPTAAKSSTSHAESSQVGPNARSSLPCSVIVIPFALSVSTDDFNAS